MNNTELPVMRPGQGRYYRAMLYHYLMVGLLAILLSILAVLVWFNPVWFTRQACNTFYFNLLARIYVWHRRCIYSVYLGCDAGFWLALTKKYE